MTQPTTYTVEARAGKAIAVPSGAHITITDVNGGQIIDTWAFNQKNVREFQSAEHTRVHVGKLFPAVGEEFVTNQRRPILRLVRDQSPGIHDLLIASCDPSRYEQLGVIGWHASCQENFEIAMAELGYIDVRIPQPINVFMNTPTLPDGHVRWLPTETSPGDHIVFEALMNIWFVVSACPQDITGINKVPGPITLTVEQNPA